MSFAFDPTLPTSKDRVRLTLGDTQSGTHLLEDETIEAELTRTASFGNTVISLAESLYMMLLRKADEQELGENKTRYRRRAENLLAQLDRWKRDGVAGDTQTVPVGFAGGELVEPNLTTYRSHL